MVTVKDACEAYLEQKPGSIAEGVFRRHVYSNPIAKVKLDKLTRSKNGEKRWKERAKSTVNRDMVPLRVALGMVLKPGAPNTDAARLEALRPFKGADKRRELYLDRDEHRTLIDATGKEAQAFVKALCLLPLRPGALADLRVRGFDKRTRSLTIGKDKNGHPRRYSPVQAARLGTKTLGSTR